MKYFKLKNDGIVVYCEEEVFMSHDEAIKAHKGGFFHSIGDLEEEKCISEEELHKKLCEIVFESKESINEKLINEIIKKAGIATFEIKFPDIPCIIVKCTELDDQYECDADRTPKFYLKSAKELEHLNYKFYYEVWLINKNGSLKRDKKLGNYFK